MPGNDAKTILVVEDDRDLLSLVAMVLETEGYKVVTATNGREGLTAVERAMPELILLDMKMPIMDGWEFAREFKARYESRVPVVVLTAAADARICAAQIGAVGWIGKPFDLNTLVGTARKHMASKVD